MVGISLDCFIEICNRQFEDALFRISHSPAVVDLRTRFKFNCTIEVIESLIQPEGSAVDQSAFPVSFRAGRINRNGGYVCCQSAILVALLQKNLTLAAMPDGLPPMPP